MDALRRGLVGLLCLTALVPATAVAAGPEDPVDQWLPRSDGAEWVYRWTNSVYSPTGRTERYAVQGRSGASFRLRWEELQPAPGATPSSGIMDFKHESAGLVNLNYQSTQPPLQFPILCAGATECGNSVAGAMYMLIWGTRSPVLSEPLLSGTRWNSVGGAANDVASVNRYRGREKVMVPAFPSGIEAAVVSSEVSQAGALGDPFGSGVRTVHWVRGVGPVKIRLRHVGGEISEAVLVSTTLKPLALPSDENLMPLNRGDSAIFRWRNTRHMKRWSRQRFDVAEVVNNTARVNVKDLSGPIRVAGSYTFATRLDGVTHLSAFTRAATTARFPPLGPASVPAAERRRFSTPFDLLTFGFGPVAPVNGRIGDTWRSSRDSRDWEVFGVSGQSKLLAPRRVRTPAGRYRALRVTSRLTQRGFRFGSGTRTSWLAPGTGLVKLVFRHGDGSVSTVERVR